ncbi:hypothetical protein F5Y00DRAFT_233114 [Daldinia vernicosa]|uniref:uncharacterized protein n=1 Tax=Daldinia vernicosa TaxID=114800 RepID=UPI002007BB35|nr:uncharacterized protein F5Y00DRAFT_233114 [Daldinia vernicosa]KAI0850333.1 hypothetical protein F5Y00DRAFT_233114 [Daldinia vernicosa]
MDDASFNIYLDEVGDEGSGYHIRNDPNPSRRYQRETVTEQRGAVAIRCKSREVIHGFLDPDSNEFATLLVYDFSFNAVKPGRRITAATIALNFSNSAQGEAPPRIQNLFPFGHFVMLPTTRQESTARSGEINAGIQFGGELGGALKWEKTTSFDANDATILNGSTECDDFGNEIGASWVLHENRSTKTGIPSFLRTAILLRREDDDKFQCTAEIHVKADWKTELENFFGSRSSDDPILFDPEKKPTNNLNKAGYPLENLASVDLKKLSDVTFHHLLEDVIKKG